MKSYTILLRPLLGALKQIKCMHFHDNPSFTKSHLHCEYQTQENWCGILGGLFEQV